MTNALKISSILFLLASFACIIKTDTNWSTESDADEEEKKVNNLSGNESKSTSSPESSSTTPSPLEKVNIVLNDETVWGRRLNSSEYDELHNEKKHDASPENSVEKNALDNVNYFLQENPATEAEVPLDNSEETSSTQSPIEMRGKELNNPSESSVVYLDFLHEPHISGSMILSINDSLPMQIEPSNSEEVLSLNSFHCAFDDEKCKMLLTDDLSSKLKEGAFTTPSTATSTPLWNIVKSSKSQESLLISTVSSTFAPVSVTPTQSSSAQTSENTIAVDDTELSKEEIVIPNLQNKSSGDPSKLDEGVDAIHPEWTSVKIDTTFPSTPFKEMFYDSPLLVTPSLSSSDSNPAQLFPRSAVSVALKEAETASKTKFYQPFSSEDIKLLETPMDSVKPSISKQVASISEIVSSDVAKENSNVNVDKVSKVQSQNFPELTSVRPSFRGPSVLLISSIEETTTSSSYLEPSYSSSHISLISASEMLTPILETVSVELSAKDVTTLAPVIKDVAGPPPRVTNPSCSSLPVCVEITLLETTWESFCTQTYEFREFLSKSVSHYTKPVFPHHIVLDTEVCLKAVRPPQNSPDIIIPFYITDDSGEYEERLTEICGVILRKWAPTAFRSSVLEVRLFNSDVPSTPLPLLPEFNSGFVAAVSISAVAGVALCLLCILLVIMKQKMLQSRNSDSATPTADAYSLDSLSINASFRRRRNRRSARSYLNHAFNDQEIPSHPLTARNLSNCLKSRDLLEEEYKKIPMNMPKLDTIPEGAHVKNRYSNILPRPESRVVLAEPSTDPLKCYINANFVKGYDGKPSTYIACQAPLPEGIEDFWRMVWEQQSRVIVMVTMFEENGTSRCAVYFPQSTLVSQQPYGDFQVSLLKKDVYEFYTMSTLRLLDLEKNLFRDIVHLWFTGWPDVGVPKDPSSLMTFVQQSKPYINCNSGPTVVHCSTGTGRTGVFLALDICSREYDESRSMDILQCVWQLRKDRAGAVQNKDQYILIYEAMMEYTTRVANQTHCPQNGTA